jgi:hypothetical protein
MAKRSVTVVTMPCNGIHNGMCINGTEFQSKTRVNVPLLRARKVAFLDEKAT